MFPLVLRHARQSIRIRAYGQQPFRLGGGNQPTPWRRRLGPCRRQLQESCPPWVGRAASAPHGAEVQSQRRRPRPSRWPAPAAIFSPKRQSRSIQQEIRRYSLTASCAAIASIRQCEESGSTLSGRGDFFWRRRIIAPVQTRAARHTTRRERSSNSGSSAREFRERVDVSL